MTDASDQTHFTVTYSHDELRAYGKLIAKRRVREQNDHTSFGLQLAAILGIGLAALAAFRLGWIEAAAVPPILFAAYSAFAAGWLSHRWLLRRLYRKFPRRTARLGPWDYSFGEHGILYKSETVEVRFAWRAVGSVEDLGPIVLFLCDDHAIFVPARMFADQAARAAFVAASAARIKTAAAP